jgi:hypothetical protein
MRFLSKMIFFGGLSFTLLTCIARAADIPVPVNSENSGLDSDAVSISNPEVINGLSPYNWVRTKDYICSAVMGASLKVAFSGTKTVALKIDTSNLQAQAALRYPILAWSVNKGPIQTHQLAAGEKSITLAASEADPVIDLYIKGMSPFENRYAGDVPANAVKIVGFTVDKGGMVISTTFPPKVWLNIGDSIMSGDAAGYVAGQARPADDTWAASDDARASYGYLLAQHYGYRESRLAFGGYDWGGGLAGIPALTQLIDQITSTVSRLSGSVLDPKPDVVVINLGENGIPPASSVTESLSKIRSRVGNDAKIIMMIPLSGKGRTELTAAFNSYKSNGPTDDYGAPIAANTYLVDLGPIVYDTADGCHPTAGGHQVVYRAALPKFNSLVQLSQDQADIHEP